MSFRELRSFTETMKALGYPRLISMENFRVPNFELVTDCLYWLVHRYYPGVEISDEISTEGDRVRFLQSVAQVMLTKARMKLNIKKLYAADGVAVKELLKVASLLHKATLKANDLEEDPSEAVDFNSSLKGFNPKEIKGHAAEILKAGAALYDALGQETELREHRARAVAGHVDTDFVERSVHEAISQVEDTVRSLEQQMEELERNEKTLDSKIEKKKQELERNEKRLATLQGVRPAYMDEYERLQGELNDLYGAYLDRFRNLEFVENELEQYYQVEQEKMEAQDKRLKKMQRKLRDEELRILRGEEKFDEARMDELDNGDDDDDEDDDDDDGDDVSDDNDQDSAPPAMSKQTLRRPTDDFSMAASRQQNGSNGGGFGSSAPRQVIGNVNGYRDEDEASIDEDENSDGGEVSMAGSVRGGHNNGGGGVDYDDRRGGGDDLGDDDDGAHIDNDDGEDDDEF